jgi:hypothetical protein
MDRRLHQRHPCNFDAKVAKLSNPDHFASGNVVDISKSGISVILPLQLAQGEIVQMNIADSRLFGQVVHSKAEGSLFRTGIEVAQVLLGGTDLSHILRRMLIAAIPATPGVHGSEAFLG